jgi:hypothetical protein
MDAAAKEIADIMAKAMEQAKAEGGCLLGYMLCR